MNEAKGFNPCKTGFVGGSDSHNTGVPFRQDNFFVGHALNDGDVKQRMSGYVFAGLDVRLESPAGLTGIWAEENTRVSLFDAMARKETFATSGPHIKVHFFGAPTAPLPQTSGLILDFDGAIFSSAWRDSLWDKFCMGAPRRQRQSVEQYKIVKRA
jgi:hypothetical protein